MKIKILIPSLVLFLLLPFCAVWPITLVRVGYVDIDRIISTYTEKYLETEITMREEYVNQLQTTYNEQYFELSSEGREELKIKIKDQNEVLRILYYNRYVFHSTGSLDEDVLLQILQRDIIEAIKKTSELEGFSLILDNTGNFIYGSEDINLTDKVLFRLDEKLLDLQNNELLAPLTLELEEDSGVK